MLGIDTNVLVRFLVRDDETQFEQACALIKQEVAAGQRVFVNHMVLIETEWVLRSRYLVPKQHILKTISGLLSANDLQFEDEACVEEALYTWKTSAVNFADCMIGAKNRRMGCRVTATFDAKASRLPGFSGI